MNGLIPEKRKLGRPKGETTDPRISLRKTNVFKQLMYAKQDLALQLVESAQDNWESITGVLMGKALEGDMRAMALLLDYVIEKAPQKFQIQTTGIDISNVSMDDLMKLVVIYDSMMQAKKETILGEAIEIESQSINQAPPPSENTANTESQNIEMEKGEGIESEAPALEPIVTPEHNPNVPQAAISEEITNE